MKIVIVLVLVLDVAMRSFEYDDENEDDMRSFSAVQ